MKKKLKRLTSFMLSAAMILPIFAEYPGGISDIVSAAETDLKVTIDSGASVTLKDTDKNSYYEISTADELYAFAASNKDGTIINGELTADIDMTDKEWTPICQTVSYHASETQSDAGYSGTFDGKGHTISNLTVTGISGDTYSYGLFGTVSGTVKNLGMVNYIYTMGSAPDARAGSIAGQIISGGTITNCYSVGHTITATDKIAGGIAGCNYGGTISNCYAKNIGVDIDNLYISQPDNGEQALEITETMVRSGAIDIVVVDSVAALVPKAEIDGDMGDSHVGLQARLMSQALRKLTAVISKSNCTVIFINQLREKVGVMFGNPETTTGGRALKFYSSVRLDVRRIESLKQAGEVIGNRTRVKVVKNKIAPPFKEAEFDIMFGQGISKVGDILDLAADLSIVVKSGAWYAYEGNKIGQGRENAKLYLTEHADVCREIEQKVRAHYGFEDVVAAAEEPKKTKKSAE